jgi:Raf kinase inhibitor-like YbhB/YbcL family protein
MSADPRGLRACIAAVLSLAAAAGLSIAQPGHAAEAPPTSFGGKGEPPRGGGGPFPPVTPGPGYPNRPTLVSSAFPQFGQLPLKYAPNAAGMVTLDATSPPLAWTRPPQGTVSVALVMTDLESSRGGYPQDLPLWMVINIPAGFTELAEGTPRGRTAMLQQGAFQKSFLTNGYIGPQPGAKAQSHHYLFELYTLDRMLDVPRDVTLDQFRAAIKGHQTGQRGVLIATCCAESK